MSTTQFVSHFVGPPSNLVVGRSTMATATGLGEVVVCGRPHALQSGVVLRPDDGRPAIERGLRALDGRFALVAIGDRKAVLATDVLGCGGAYVGDAGGGIHRRIPSWAGRVGTPLPRVVGSTWRDGCSHGQFLRIRKDAL